MIINKYKDKKRKKFKNDKLNLKKKGSIVARINKNERIERREEKFFLLNFKMTKNNLLFTIYKLNGELIYWINLKSSKIAEKGKIKYVTKYSVLDLLDRIIRYLRSKRFWYTLKIKFFGLKVFRRMFKFLTFRIIWRVKSSKVISVTYYSTIMHNGCFARKKRR